MTPGGSSTGDDIAFVGFLLALSASFSASEAALFSLDAADRERLVALGGRGAAAALRLLERPRRLLVAILFGNLAVNTTLIAHVEAMAERTIGPAGLGAAVAVSTLLLLFFGEILPQRIAIRHRRSFSALAARPLEILHALLGPFVSVVEGLLARAVRERGFGVAEEVTEEEIVDAVEAAAETGEIEDDDRTLVRGVLALDELRAFEIMTPRDRMAALPRTASWSAVRDLVRRTGVTRVPIFDGTIDNVVGALDLHDLVVPVAAGRPVPLSRVLRPVAYAPRWRRADALLREMRGRGARLAIVVDDHGAATGLVTTEDILGAVLGRSEERRSGPPEGAA